MLRFAVPALAALLVAFPASAMDKPAAEGVAPVGITHVRTVSITISDHDRALDFYVNKLGFTKLMDATFGQGYRWIEVAPAGSQTVLVLAKGFGQADRMGKLAGIVFETADLMATCQQLEQRGVEFVEKPAKRPWGYQAQIKDQDGNILVLHQTVRR